MCSRRIDRPKQIRISTGRLGRMQKSVGSGSERSTALVFVLMLMSGVSATKIVTVSGRSLAGRLSINSINIFLHGERQGVALYRDKDN